MGLKNSVTKTTVGILSGFALLLPPTSVNAALVNALPADPFLEATLSLETDGPQTSANDFGAGNHRIFGADRFETAAKLSQKVYNAGAETVVLANGLSFADALSAAPLAAKLGAPLLLTAKDVLHSSTSSEISRLKPDSVLIIGGTGVISKTQESELKNKGLQVTRIGGADRYETSAKIAQYGWADGTENALIATGQDFADALSAAPVASKLGAPVILVPPSAGDSISQTVVLLKELEVSELHIAGGTGAVTAAVEKELLKSGAQTQRYAGKDRYETSAALLKEHFAAGTKTVFITSGLNFPDAVGGAAAAGALDSAIALSLPVCIPKTSLAEVKRIKAESLVALGGPTVITDEVLALTECSGKHSRGYDITSASSIQVVVNKKRPLSPIRYVPKNMRYPNVSHTNKHMMHGEAATAMEQMFAAANQAGHRLYLSSGYRSYDTENSLYHGYITQYGQAWADSQAAKAGHSEHQTGLTADIFAWGYPADQAFGATPAGKWLRDNSYKYGFILRYEDGMRHKVGYTYEPWHFRYIGVEVATAYKQGGYRSLEDFFGLAAAPDY